MRLGTLQLADNWDETQAQIVALRFRELETELADLQLTPHANIYAAQTPGMALTISPSGTTCVLTGAQENYIQGFDLLSNTTTSRLTARSPGHYFANYTVSFTTSDAGRHMEVAVLKNGVWQAASASHLDVQTAAMSITVHGTIIVLLRRGDYIETGIRCNDNTTSIIYEQFNSTIFKVHF